MIVGQSRRVVVGVRSADSGAFVDPATFAFTIRAHDAATTYPPTRYEWSASSGVWTPTSDAFGVPSRTGTGSFAIVVTIPYANAAAGRWVIGWQTTSNALGEGGGVGEHELHASTSGAI